MAHRPVVRPIRWARVALPMAMLALTLGIAGAVASEPPVSAENSPTGASGAVFDEADGWILSWRDEFDGPSGSPPDPAVWGYDLGDGSAIGLPGWGNNERQWYTDEAANAALDGEGHLVLTARRVDAGPECYYGPCEYTSARLLTKDRFEFQHGRLEARIRVPGGFGLWPAFWMLGSNIDAVGWPASGEIDVMEFVGRRPNEILGTLHGPGYSGSGGISGGIDLGEPIADAFHTVALEWGPGQMTWFLDGSPYHHVGSDDVSPNAWVFEQPFFLLLNVAVGGNLGGPVFPDTLFPTQLLVDYVRLYQAAPA